MTDFPTVFAVTVVVDAMRSRCWGVAPTFADAEAAVLKNVTDLAEYEYGYAVIEECYFCIPSCVAPEREWWFEWSGSWDDGGYQPIPKPAAFDGIVGWGIG